MPGRTTQAVPPPSELRQNDDTTAHLAAPVRRCDHVCRTEAQRQPHDERATRMQDLKRVELPDKVTWGERRPLPHAWRSQPQARLFAWGRNAAGQLGQGGSGRKDERKPLKLSALSGAIASTAPSALRLPCRMSTARGRLQSGGSARQVPEGSMWCELRVVWCAGVKLVGMAAGAEHSLAHSQQGEVFTWGSPGAGRLGFRGEKVGLFLSFGAHP